MDVRLAPEGHFRLPGRGRQNNSLGTLFLFGQFFFLIPDLDIPAVKFGQLYIFENDNAAPAIFFLRVNEGRVAVTYVLAVKGPTEKRTFRIALATMVFFEGQGNTEIIVVMI